jgi:hypothetical protein
MILSPSPRLDKRRLSGGGVTWGGAQEAVGSLQDSTGGRSPPPIICFWRLYTGLKFGFPEPIRSKAGSPSRERSKWQGEMGQLVF